MGIVKNKRDTGIFIETMESFSEGQEITLRKEVIERHILYHVNQDLSEFTRWLQP